MKIMTFTPDSYKGLSSRIHNTEETCTIRWHRGPHGLVYLTTTNNVEISFCDLDSDVFPGLRCFGPLALHLAQDSVGGQIFTFKDKICTKNGVEIDLSLAPNSRDILTVIVNHKKRCFDVVGFLKDVRLA